MGSLAIPRRLGALLGAALLAASACTPAASTAPNATSGTPAGTAGTTEPTATAGIPSGGTLSVGNAGEIQWLDPALGYDTVSWPAERLVYEALLDYDANSKLIPLLASEMPTVSADGTVVTVKLHDNVNFVKADGTVLRKMTADDVAFSINRNLNPKLKPYPSPVGTAFFSNIVGATDVLAGTVETATGIKVIDPTTVEFDLVRGDATFLNVLATPFASVVPKELAAADADAFAAAPVGTGQFLFKSYTKGQGAQFVRNPAYWQAGLPHLDGVDYRTGQDGNSELQQIEAGTLDLTQDPMPPAQYTDATTNYADQVAKLTLNDTDYVFMDTQMPNGGPFSKLEVRQAVNYAIDKDAILQITHGAGQAANCIFPPNLPGYDSTCNPYPHDVDKAKTLMAQAGLAAGFETKFFTDTTDPDPQIGSLIQQDLQAIGIKTDIVSQEFATFLDTIETPHKAPIGWVGWFQDYPDPSDFIDPLFGCASIVQGGTNASQYCNKAVDDLAATAKGMTDPSQRLAAYQDIQKKIMADAPWAPFRHQEWVTLIGKRVGGLTLHPVWLIDIKQLWINPS